MEHRSRIILALLAFTSVQSLFAASERLEEGGLSLTLNESKNYALESVEVNGVLFPSGGGFPTFHVYDESGVVKKLSATNFPPAKIERDKNGIKVSYESKDFAATVTYAITKGKFFFSVRPTMEKDLKVITVSDKGALVSVPSSVPGAEKTGFLLRPLSGGELIPFSPERKTMEDTQYQHWQYNAGFCGLAYNGQGLLVRTPQFGAMWTVKTGNIRGIYSLSCGLAADFRPRKDQPGPYNFWKMPLCEPQIDIEMIPVGETNGDGIMNWVDMGVAYRKHFIRRNPKLDPDFPESIMGKIGIAEYTYKGKVLTYDKLIKQIAAVDFANQIWWLLGGQTPPEHNFELPTYGPPDPSHNGPNGYDYYQFKKDAKKYGARIGLHDYFQESSKLNKDWGTSPMRTQEFGVTMGTWTSKIPSGEFVSHSKALHPSLESGQFLRELKEHFDLWQAGPGDTWHWDIFTSFCQQDFTLEHPVTHGQDYRDRIKVLKAMQDMGIYFTSEGMQEGMAEYCTFGYQGRIIDDFKSQFPGGRSVPLTPVLFQGTSYYTAGSKIGICWALAMGGCVGYEDTFLDRDIIIERYFGHNMYWSKICDRMVHNMTETENGWRVDYEGGGHLLADFKNDTFTLEVDGEVYTPKKTPTNARGFYAERDADGKYHVIYPSKKPGKNTPAEASR